MHFEIDRADRDRKIENSYVNLKNLVPSIRKISVFLLVATGGYNEIPAAFSFGYRFANWFYGPPLMYEVTLSVFSFFGLSSLSLSSFIALLNEDQNSYNKLLKLFFFVLGFISFLPNWITAFFSTKDQGLLPAWLNALLSLTSLLSTSFIISYGYFEAYNSIMLFFKSNFSSKQFSEEVIDYLKENLKETEEQNFIEIYNASLEKLLQLRKDGHVSYIGDTDLWLSFVMADSFGFNLHRSSNISINSHKKKFNFSLKTFCTTIVAVTASVPFFFSSYGYFQFFFNDKIPEVLSELISFVIGILSYFGILSFLSSNLNRVFSSVSFPELTAAHFKVRNFLYYTAIFISSLLSSTSTLELGLRSFDFFNGGLYSNELPIIFSCPLYLSAVIIFASEFDNLLNDNQHIKNFLIGSSADVVHKNKVGMFSKSQQNFFKSVDNSLSRLDMEDINNSANSILTTECIA